MSEKFSLVVAPHKAFGALATLTVSGQPPRRFTKQEALIVSRALDAVATGASPERQIYMSPIASDLDFDAQVEAAGVSIGSAAAAVRLNWPETLAMANELWAFGSSQIPQKSGGRPFAER